MRNDSFSAFNEPTAVTKQVTDKTQLVFTQLKHIGLCC